MSKLPTGFHPLRDEREWYWKAAEVIARSLDALIAHSPDLSRFLKARFTPPPRPSL